MNAQQISPTVKRYRVKLHNPDTASGYLESFGKVGSYSRADALKKAIAFNGKIEGYDLSFYSTDLKMGQVDENCLLDGVVKLLKHFEPFKQKNHTDSVYHADVFQDILNECVGSTKINNQLNELANYFSAYDYVMIINRK